MMIEIPQALNAEQLKYCRGILEVAKWSDGRKTAGNVATTAKNNLQLPAGCPEEAELGEIILQAISFNPRFVSSALPLRVLPPMFNCYRGGGNYGVHVDNAIRNIPGEAQRLRSDISCTLFLSAPEEYEGGELFIEDAWGNSKIKLPAGTLIVYPGSSLHCVAPVTKGARFAAIFWVQSFVRNDSRRSILFNLDNAIQTINNKIGNDPEIVRLTGVYHNLLREWAEI